MTFPLGTSTRASLLPARGGAPFTAAGTRHSRFGLRRTSAAAAIALSLVSGLLTGCEVSNCSEADQQKGVCVQGESLTRFEVPGTETTLSIPYTAGTNLRIDGVYGRVRVNLGATGVVSATFRPFSYRGNSKSAEAQDEIRTKFDKRVELDTGTIVVQSGRHDSTNGLGADIDVLIPPELDGVLIVENHGSGPINPGDISIASASNAPELWVKNGPLGDCDVIGGPKVVKSTLSCDGGTRLSAVRDALDITVTGLANDLEVRLDGVTAGSPGGTLQVESGSLTLAVPGVGDYSIQAQANGAQKVVNEGTLPSGCGLQTASAASKTITCGRGGPNYALKALSGDVKVILY